MIENDFHDRRDLTPNLCALYVEAPFRGRGLAGELLAFARREMSAGGVKRLYLATDLVSFYERYGWSYLTHARRLRRDNPDLHRRMQEDFLKRAVKIQII